MIKFNRFSLLLLLIFQVPFLSAGQPNVVLIFVDDLGYGSLNLARADLDVFKNPSLFTPNLSALAEESLVLTHHYAASPVCSPSRAGLLTGRTPTRSNINLFIRDTRDDDRYFLRGWEVTIAEILKSTGYQTAVFGKWHLNGADWEDPGAWKGWTGSFPKQQGFDEGIVSKENPHFTRLLEVNTQKHPGDFFTVDGDAVGPVKGYTSDILADYACRWMEKAVRGDRPFFLYLPFDAVHIRIAAADRYEELYQTGNARKDAYYANITHLDAAIGRVINHIDDLGLAEETLIIFSSDNGPAIPRGNPEFSYFCYGTSYPLTGAKFQLYEGGIRVPGMVRWKGTIESGVSDLPNSTLDLLPTLCELVGTGIPRDRAIDGISLLSHWTKRDIPERSVPMYWQYEYPNVYTETTGEGYERRFVGESKLSTGIATPHVCIRTGDYVLLGISETRFTEPAIFELYNVSEDPGQTRDIRLEEEQIFKSMKEQLLQLYREVNEERERTDSIQLMSGESTMNPGP